MDGPEGNGETQDSGPITPSVPAAVPASLESLVTLINPSVSEQPAVQSNEVHNPPLSVQDTLQASLTNGTGSEPERLLPATPAELPISLIRLLNGPALPNDEAQVTRHQEVSAEQPVITTRDEVGFEGPSPGALPDNAAPFVDASYSGEPLVETFAAPEIATVHKQPGSPPCELPDDIERDTALAAVARELAEVLARQQVDQEQHQSEALSETLAVVFGPPDIVSAEPFISTEQKRLAPEATETLTPAFDPTEPAPADFKFNPAPVHPVLEAFSIEPKRLDVPTVSEPFIPEASLPRPVARTPAPPASPPAEPVAAKPLIAPPPVAKPMPAAKSWRDIFWTGLRYLAYGVAGYAALVVVLIFLYRFINPPVSALMVQQWVTGEDVQQDWVPLSAISPNLVRAVVVSEDNRFCDHWGIDLQEVSNALERGGRGASTISMQVSKNLFLWPSKSYVRKAVEVPITLLIEIWWPKSRIMEVYLNIAEWGPGRFGAEQAALWHFSKAASGLSESEAARLAVALPNPIQRDAGDPGPGTLRLASIIQARMRYAPRSVTSCIGGRSSQRSIPAPAPVPARPPANPKIPAPPAPADAWKPVIKPSRPAQPNRPQQPRSSDTYQGPVLDQWQAR